MATVKNSKVSRALRWFAEAVLVFGLLAASIYGGITHPDPIAIAEAHSR